MSTSRRATQRQRRYTLEGELVLLNNLIQAAKARGYRTFDNLKAIVYILTGKLDYSEIELPT